MSTNIAPYSGGTPQILRGTQVSGEDIQHVLVADSAGNLVGSPNTSPTTTDRGLTTRNIPAAPVTTGSMGALNAVVVHPMHGAASVSIHVKGTFTATYACEVSPDDGVTWSAQVSGFIHFPTINLPQTLFNGQATASPAVFRLNVGGYTHVRVRVYEYTSGTLDARIQSSYTNASIMLSHSLPTGTNTIGSIGNLAANPAATRLSDGASYLTTTGGKLAVDNSGQTQPVGDAGGSLTVDSPQLPSALVSDRLAVDGSGVTQPVSIAGTLPVGDAGASLTVDAPQGTPVFTRLTDGTNNAAITNSEPTSSTYGIVTRAIQQSTPTFWAVYDRVSPATNKYMAVLWNTTSTRLVKVRRIWRMDWQAAAVVGVLLEQELRFITARTGVGTTVTPVPTDTADTLTAGIEASHNATGVTDGGMLSRIFAASEEVVLAATGQVLGFSSDERYQIVYEESRGSAKPITIRQNRGIAIKNITASTIGTVSYIIEFTDEAV